MNQVSDELQARQARVEHFRQSVRSFDELVAGLEEPQLLGPDADGVLWLSGRREELAGATRLRPEFVEQALAWRGRAG